MKQEGLHTKEHAYSYVHLQVGTKNHIHKLFFLALNGDVVVGEKTDLVVELAQPPSVLEEEGLFFNAYACTRIHFAYACVHFQICTYVC